MSALSQIRSFKKNFLKTHTHLEARAPCSGSLAERIAKHNVWVDTLLRFKSPYPNNDSTKSRGTERPTLISSGSPHPPTPIHSSVVFFDFQENFYLWELEGEHGLCHVGADRDDRQVSGLAGQNLLTFWPFIDVSGFY